MYAPLKKGDLVIVERHQFLVIDKNTTIELEASEAGVCAVAIYGINRSKLEECPRTSAKGDFKLTAYVARNLEGTIYNMKRYSNTSNIIVGLGPDAKTVDYHETETKLPRIIEIQFEDSVFNSIEESHDLTGVKKPKVIIPKVIITNIGNGN